MPINHTFIGLDGGGVGVNMDKYPDVCPVCGNGIHPNFLAMHETRGKPLKNYKIRIIEAMFRCPLHDCLAIFSAKYMQASIGSSNFYLKDTKQIIFSKIIEFPQEIESTSPAFVAIYNQASVAEENCLDEVCGCAYRRALEFLMKDFLISQKPDDKEYEESIKKNLLGKCIEKINDPVIQKMAKRASWLGNDETHYYRKWEDHDLEDLKKLINITVSSINTSLLAQKYEKEMPEC